MEWIDQLQQRVQLDSTPSRIVSLVPSQTELLHALGLDDEVVGITKFCIYPEPWYSGKIRIGGTKNVSFERVRELKPDLIIGNKEENEASDIHVLAQEFPVWMSDIYTLEDALQMIDSLGEIIGRQENSTRLIEEIKKRFEAFDLWRKTQNFPKRKVAYFIWDDPKMTSGKNTFIDAMLEVCGLENVVTEDRYPEWKANRYEAPEFVLLSSEPFPFKEIHVRRFQQEFPDSKIVRVDGEMFSWYGSRLALAPAYFRSLLEQLASD